MPPRPAGDEDVEGLEVAVEDGGAVGVEGEEAHGGLEHEGEGVGPAEVGGAVEDVVEAAALAELEDHREAAGLRGGRREGAVEARDVRRRERAVDAALLEERLALARGGLGGAPRRVQDLHRDRAARVQRAVHDACRALPEALAQLHLVIGDHPHLREGGGGRRSDNVVFVVVQRVWIYKRSRTPFVRLRLWLGLWLGLGLRGRSDDLDYDRGRKRVRGGRVRGRVRDRGGRVWGWSRGWKGNRVVMSRVGRGVRGRVRGGSRRHGNGARAGARSGSRSGRVGRWRKRGRECSGRRDRGVGKEGADLG